MLSHLSFDVGPEGFNAIDMVMVFDELFGMVDSSVLVAVKDQAVIASPSVSVDIAL